MAPSLDSRASVGPGGQGPFAVIGRLLEAEVGGGSTGAGSAAATKEGGAVVVNAGRITEVAATADRRLLPARRFEAAYIAPGFIDMQVNGGFGFEVGDDPHALGELAIRLPATGVTAFCPTLVSRTEPAYQRAFQAYAVFAADAGAAAGAGGSSLAPATALGLHLEGPLLSLNRVGAHARAAIAAADAALVSRLADPRVVRLVTLAPERTDCLPLIAALAARGVVVALGHTDASWDDFTAGATAGARVATHVFNAMSPFHHRAPGAVGAALTDDRIVVSIIADGVHTHPAAFRLAVRAKGIEGLALVTDAIAAAAHHATPGASTLAGRAVTVDARSARLDDGTLAGSLLTMDAAVRNAIAFAGLSIEQAVHLATAVPARVLGLAHKGALTVGADADLVLLDDSLQVVKTFVGGALAYSRDGDPSGDAGAGAGVNPA